MPLGTPSSGGISFPSISAAQVVHVSKAGNDSTGTGQPDNPFLTLQAAVDAIVDASQAKQYLIEVGPGDFAPPTKWPRNVHLRGAGAGLSHNTLLGTSINAILSVAGASTHGDGNFFSNVNFQNQIYYVDNSNLIQFGHFIGCQFNGLIRSNGSQTQVFVYACQNFAGVFGLVGHVNGCYIRGDVKCGVSGGGWYTTSILNLHNCRVDGDIISEANTTAIVRLRGTTVGGELRHTGDVTIETDGNLPPINPVSGSATITRKAAASALAFTPTTGTDWDGAPTSLQEALDQLAARVRLLE